MGVAEMGIVLIPIIESLIERTMDATASGRPFTRTFQL